MYYSLRDTTCKPAGSSEAPAALASVHSVRQVMQVLGVSARSGAGMSEYLELLEAGLAAARGTATTGGGR